MTTVDVEKFALIAYTKMIADGLCIVRYKARHTPYVLRVDMVESDEVNGMMVCLTFDEILRDREAMNNLFSYMVDRYIDEKHDEGVSPV